MKSNPQPKLKLQLNAFDRLLEALGLLAVILIWAMLFYFFKKLPSVIPIHFNSEGKIDGYGNRLILIFEPIMASILYFGLTFLNRYSHLFNYLSPINEGNAEYQYRLATRLIRYLKLLIVLLFVFIMWSSIQAVTSKDDGLGIVFLPVFIALIIIPTLFVLIKSTKTRKTV